jgi:AraC family transcriptional regulator, regulatory protein of adaptative response / DNA-3-methyladenine glycosylase II
MVEEAPARLAQIGHQRYDRRSCPISAGRGAATCNTLIVAAIATEPELAYRIARSKDRRYDDQFVIGSLSTGIFCRPSCLSAAPRRENARIFPSPAAAESEGLRPCKRCQPQGTASGSSTRQGDVAARALRLIEDGLVDREGVGGLAARLGYSQRQLNRILISELGASPVALARLQRAHSARLLLDSSDLTLSQVARAAGFGSIRQFNETMREAFGMAPSAMRVAARMSVAALGNAVRLKLACQEPFDGVAVVRFLSRHEVPGLERVQRNSYTRALALEHGDAVVTLTPGSADVVCDLRLEDLRDLTTAVARCRRLFDLDADPAAVGAHLGELPLIGELVREHPGVRIPGTVDGFELAVRTILRENNTPEATRQAASDIVRRFGRPLPFASEAVTHNFPTAATLASIDPSDLGVDEVRARAITVLASRVANGDIVLDAGAELDGSISKLLAVPGIGPWIASYLAMRVLGDPDAFLYGCQRLERALKRLGFSTEIRTIAATAEQWRPWRSYAVAQLWRSLDDEDEAS